MSKWAPLNLKIWQFLWSWHGLWYHLHHFLPREQNISKFLHFGPPYFSVFINTNLTQNTFLVDTRLWFMVVLYSCIVIMIIILFYDGTVTLEWLITYNKHGLRQRRENKWFNLYAPFSLMGSLYKRW